jgi:hypothetical protein
MGESGQPLAPERELAPARPSRRRNPLRLSSMTSNQGTNSSVCPGCGAKFHCGLADSGGCWCARLPALQRERYDVGAGCLCEACLRKQLAGDAAQPPAGPSIT